MPDLRISHHSRRQADARAVRLEQCAGIFFRKLIVERCCRECDRVAISRSRITPPVDNDQGQRPSFFSHDSLATNYADRAEKSVESVAKICRKALRPA